jgi:hypothetical protein
MKRIVSAVPGRLRIKDGALADRALCERIALRLTQDLAITSTRINTGAASIVVAYDTDAMSPGEAHLQIERVFAEEFPPPQFAPRRRSRRLRVNRYAKLVALTSLGASLAFAAAGQKRMHVLTGTVFVASLGVHLAIFRRTLVR